MDNYPRYYNVSKLAWDTEVARGVKPIVVAVNGDWDFAKGGQVFPAHSTQDVENAIKLAVSKLKSGESLTLFVNDHGSSPNSVNEPLSSEIVLYGGTVTKLPPQLSHSDLMNLIKKYVPQENNVKLVGVHCFSGGLHSIAFNLPNVCSAASTDFRTPTKTTGEINLYGKGFWNEVRSKTINLTGNGKTNLYEAHLAGTMMDTENEGRGELSSMAYVDSVLGYGAYDGKDPARKEKKIHGKTIVEISIGPPGPKLPDLCNLNSGGIDIEKIQAISSDIADILKEAALNVSGKGPSAQPLRNVYEYVAAEWAKNKETDVAKLKRLQLESEKLHKEWNNFSSVEKWWKRADYTKKFDALEAKTKEELGRFLAVYHTMQRLDRVNAFMKKATPAQKEKFASLLKCEWSPL